MKKQKITYLSLGTNQGDKIKNLQNAINLIALEVGDVKKVASIYKTASWGFSGKDFYNTCIKVLTHKTPEVVLETILNIENKLGRKRTDTNTYQNRNIDIDILLFEDDIILSKDLMVPHPKMLDRKFVLVPLIDIAPNKIHPIKKVTISTCLKNCNDSSDIIKIDEKLIRPLTFQEKYNYIAIEGNIGAGKTSLTKMIGNDFNAKVVLERFAENPFLPKFYKDKERYGFPLEMSFLVDRYQQLNDDFAQLDLFKSFVVSDYYIFKSLIFAQITLSKDEYLIYRKMFDLMYKEVTKPDLYIYLYQSTERLLENIKKRGRDYEQCIKPQYLKNIHEGYSSFITTQKELNYVIIDVSDIDFVTKEIDYNFIINKIKYN